MSDEKRPGGLTAMAILSFIFAAIGILGMLGWVFLLVAPQALDAAERLAEEGSDPKASEQIGVLASIVKENPGGLWVLIALSGIATIALIMAGIGYLRQTLKGRKFGNIYAALSLLSAVLGIILVKLPFDIGSMIGLIFPVMTLILINTTFKDDLVN